MFEIELKFQIKNDKKDAFLKALQRKKCDKSTIHTQYFDHDKCPLSTQGIGLQQRLENGQWTQILHLSNTGQLAPTQFQINLGTTAPNNFEFKNFGNKNHHKSISKNTQKLLNDLSSELYVKFSIDIERFITSFNFQKSLIEVYFDQGLVYSQQQKREFSEITFKLKKGNIQDFISFVLPRIKRYALYLNTQTKTHYDDLLSQNIPAQFQTPFQLDPKSSPEQAIKKIVQHTLQHLLPNSSAIASGCFTEEHVHQARVAIRRLRSALKTFAHWSSHLDLTWEQQLAELFRQLGHQRDLDMVESTILPEILADGAPNITLKKHKNIDENKLDDVFKSFNFHALILTLIQFIHTQHSEPLSLNLKKQFRKEIEKLHQNIINNSFNFLELTIDDQHRVRKRLKRLRYSIEFIASLYPTEKVKEYLKALKPAQEALGLYNDLFVAENIFKSISEHDAKALFALGWIAARKHDLLAQSAQELRHLSQAVPFWK